MVPNQLSIIILIMHTIFTTCTLAYKMKHLCFQFFVCQEEAANVSAGDVDELVYKLQPIV